MRTGRRSDDNTKLKRQTSPPPQPRLLGKKARGITAGIFLRARVYTGARATNQGDNLRRPTYPHTYPRTHISLNPSVGAQALVKFPLYRDGAADELRRAPE